MKVLRPIKSNYKFQGFGEAKACATQLSDGRILVSAMPSNGICPAGQQNLYTEILGMKGHNGEDWALWHGEPIYFPVIDDIRWWAKTEVDNAGGIGVNVISFEPVSLDGQPSTYLKFKFWHLQKVAVSDKQEIKAGQLLGYGNSTGLSSGNHLHWSFKKCDQSGEPLDRWNGYYGAMDFTPWFENRFVFDIIKERQEAEIRLAEEARQKEEAALLRAELEARIKESQLSLIQLLHKFIFILQENLRKVGKGLGGLFR